MPHRSAKILVVDDQEVGRQLLDSFLYKEGYEVIFAEDGEQALQNAIKESPDLILMDVMMPKMDGFEATRLLRKEQKLADVPVVLVTALDDRDSRLQGLEVGADEYITKPIDRVELLTRIKNLLQLTQYRKGVESENEISDETESRNLKPGEPLTLLNHHLIKSHLHSDKFSLTSPENGNFTFCHHTIHGEQYYLLAVSNDNLTEVDVLIGSLYKDILIEKQNIDPDIVLEELLTQLLSLEDYTPLKIDLAIIKVNENRSQIEFCGISSNIIIFSQNKWNDLNGSYINEIKNTSDIENISKLEFQLQSDDQMLVIPASSMNNMDYSKLMHALRSDDSSVKNNLKEFAVGEKENLFYCFI